MSAQRSLSVYSFREHLYLRGLNLTSHPFRRIIEQLHRIRPSDMQAYSTAFDMDTGYVDSQNFQPAAALGDPYGPMDGQSFLHSHDNEQASANSFSSGNTMVNAFDSNSPQSSTWTADSADTLRTPTTPLSSDMDCSLPWRNAVVPADLFPAQTMPLLDNPMSQPCCPSEGILLNQAADEASMLDEWSKHWQDSRENRAVQFANSAVVMGNDSPSFTQEYWDGRLAHISVDMLPNSAWGTTMRQPALVHRRKTSNKNRRKCTEELDESSSTKLGDSVTTAEKREKSCKYAKCPRKFQRQEHLTRHMRLCKYSDQPVRRYYCPLAIEFGKLVCCRDKNDPFKERSDNLTQHLMTHCSGFATHQSRNSTFHKRLIETVVARAKYTEPGQELTLQNREARIKSIVEGLNNKKKSGGQTDICEAKWNVHIDHDYMKKLFPNGFLSCEDVADATEAEGYKPHSWQREYDHEMPWCCGWVSGGPKASEPPINLPSDSNVLARVKRTGSRAKGQKDSNSRRPARMPAT